MSAQDPIAERLRALKAELEEMGGEIARKAGEGSKAFARAEARVKESARAGAEAAKAAAAPLAEEALEEARRAAEDFADAARSASTQARQTALAHPLATVGAFFLAGLVLGSLRRR